MATTIRIDSGLEDFIAKNGRFKETSNDVLRRLLGLSDLKKEKHLAGGNRYFIFGHSGVSILKWMRDDGWSEAAARKVFESFEQHIDENTIKAQFNPKREGRVAKLTPEQERELNARRRAAGY